VVGEAPLADGLDTPAAGEHGHNRVTVHLKDQKITKIERLRRRSAPRAGRAAGIGGGGTAAVNGSRPGGIATRSPPVSPIWATRSTSASLCDADVALTTVRPEHVVRLGEPSCGLEPPGLVRIRRCRANCCWVGGARAGAVGRPRSHERNVSRNSCGERRARGRPRHRSGRRYPAAVRPAVARRPRMNNVLGNYIWSAGPRRGTGDDCMIELVVWP
jgi:hypothetical protein